MGADWRRATGAGSASPPWSRSCCSGWGCASTTPGRGGRRSTTRPPTRQIAANLERGDGLHAPGAAATQPSSNYSPGLPLLVAGVYGRRGGVHERARPRRPRPARLALGALHLSDRPPPLRSGSRGLIGAAAVAIYPALLEYQGMLMSEPLAATLLSGAVLAMFWAGDARRPRAAWLLPGVLLGATAMVRPEYLAVAFLLGAGGLRSRRGQRRWRRSLAQAAILLAGVVARGRPLDDPQRRRPRPLRADLDRRRPGAVRRHLPALRTATRKRSAPRSSPAIPELFGLPPHAQHAAPGADPRPARRRALPEPGKRPGALADGPGTALGRHHRRAARIRRLRRRQGRRGSGRTARATSCASRSGRPCTGRWSRFGLLGLGRARLAAALGGAGAGDDLPLDHRAQRPAGRLSAAGAGDAAAGRRARRGWARPGLGRAR